MQRENWHVGIPHKLHFSVTGWIEPRHEFRRIIGWTMREYTEIVYACEEFTSGANSAGRETRTSKVERTKKHRFFLKSERWKRKRGVREWKRRVFRGDASLHFCNSSFSRKITPARKFYCVVVPRSLLKEYAFAMVGFFSPFPSRVEREVQLCCKLVYNAR